MSFFLNGELWGDGSGGSQVVTTSFVDGTWFRVGTDSLILMALDISGTAPTNLDIQADWSPDGGTTAYPFDASIYDGDGVYLIDDAVYQLQGTITDSRTLQINLPQQTFFRISLRRVGGDGTTAVYIGGYARPPFPRARSAGSTIGVGDPEVTFEAVCETTDLAGDCVVIAGDDVGGLPSVRVADITSDRMIIGVIEEKLTTTSCVVRQAGLSDAVYSGLTPGVAYMVSDTGRLTDTRPIAGIGEIVTVQHIGVAYTEAAIVVSPKLPIKGIYSA